MTKAKRNALKTFLKSLDLRASAARQAASVCVSVETLGLARVYATEAAAAAAADAAGLSNDWVVETVYVVSAEGCWDRARAACEAAGWPVDETEVGDIIATHCEAVARLQGRLNYHVIANESALY